MPATTAPATDEHRPASAGSDPPVPGVSGAPDQPVPGRSAGPAAASTPAGAGHAAPRPRR